MEWLIPIGQFIHDNGLAALIAILLLAFLGFKVWPDLMKRLDRAYDALQAVQAAHEVRLREVQEAHEARILQMRTEHTEDRKEARVSFLEALSEVTKENTGAIQANTEAIAKNTIEITKMKSRKQ